MKHATFEPAANISKYVMPAPVTNEPPRMPEPVAILGDFVKVVGRVRPSFETRKIIAQSVGTLIPFSMSNVLCLMSL